MSNPNLTPQPGAAPDFTEGQPRRRIPLHTKILIGLLLGVALGLAANWFGRLPVVEGIENPADVNANGLHDRLEWFAQNITEPAGKIFLRLMFMVVLPLVFSALALAVVEIGDVRRLGKLGLRTLFFTAILSSTAVVLGITLVDVIKPGHSLSPEKRDELKDRYAQGASASVEQAKKAKPLRDLVVDMLPENPLQEMVGAIDGTSKGNGMLAVMVFALILGAAITTVPEKCGTLVGWLEGFNAISMVVIGWAMRLAPWGPDAWCSRLHAPWLRYSENADVLRADGRGGTGIALGRHLLDRAQPFQPHVTATVLSRAREAMLVAFGTSSSNATLPTAIKVAEADLRLPKEISRFVLTVGATGNQNGTALYEGVVVLFMAQVFGIELTVAQQIQVVLMSILAGVGTAGVPGGSLPLIVVLMQSVGVPGEGIGIIMGIDRLLDMCRTVLNVTGDLVVATCVAGGSKTPDQLESA